MFKPYKGKVEILPTRAGGIIQSDSLNLEEEGVVVAVGEGVEGIREGDTLYFRSYGCDKTPEKDGKSHYVVTVSEEFILGVDAPVEAE